MTKADFLKRMHGYGDGEITRTQTDIAYDAFITALTQALRAGESVVFAGFGTFSVAERAGRQGRNPRTGEKIEIPAGKAVKFSASRNLKEAVN